MDQPRDLSQSGAPAAGAGTLAFVFWTGLALLVGNGLFQWLRK